MASSLLPYPRGIMGWAETAEFLITISCELDDLKLEFIYKSTFQSFWFLSFEIIVLLISTVISLTEEIDVANGLHYRSHISIFFFNKKKFISSLTKIFIYPFNLS